MSVEAMFEFLKFTIPLAVAVFGWYWNERSKRLAEEYERKELKYAALIESLQGFYVGNRDSDEARAKKARFLAELNNCWLYCPDDVIRRAYDFLMTVHTGVAHADDAKERALGELVVFIRKDMLARTRVRSTQLTAADFRHLRVN